MSERKHGNAGHQESENAAAAVTIREHTQGHAAQGAGEDGPGKQPADLGLTEAENPRAHEMGHEHGVNHPGRETDPERDGAGTQRGQGGAALSHYCAGECSLPGSRKAGVLTQGSASAMKDLLAMLLSQRYSRIRQRRRR
ncbi:MAG: hypothetical protein ACREU8_10610 [Gammaproteobacteria bacterium]